LDNDLITSDQVKSIREFEESIPKKNLLVNTFIAIASTVIGIGIISLIAANWISIPDWLKLGTNFLLLTGCGLGVYLTHKRKHLVAFEGLMVLFVFLCLASIGVISQVYHTGGKLEHALLFWCAMTLPLISLSKRFYLPFLWSCIIIAPVVMLIDGHLFSSFRNQFALIASTTPLVCGLIASILDFTKINEYFLKSFRYLVFTLGLGAVFWADFFGYFWRSSIRVEALIPSLVLVIISAFLFIMRKDVGNKRKIVFCLLLTFYELIFVLQVFDAREKFWGAFIDIPLLIFASIYFLSIDYKRVFSFLSALIGIRFLIVYFQAFGGLATTGFGLILSGILLLVFVKLWIKFNPKFEKWTTEIMEPK
jgi:uncharacterized membrane protein